MEQPEKEKSALMKIALLVKERVVEADIGNSATIIAYYLLFSLFPLIIVIGNLLPYLPFQADEILAYISTAIPGAVFNVLKPTLRSLLTESSGGLLSVGAIAALWSASKGMNALQNSMNKAYGAKNRINFIVVRLASLFFTLALVLSIGIIVIVFSFGQQVLDLIDIPLGFIETFQSLKWPVTITALFVILIMLYYLVPNVRLKIRHVLPGAAFATIGWVLLTQGFAFYVSYFAGRTLSYGSIGVFIVLMLWLYFAGYILTLGAVVNAVITEYRHGDKLKTSRSDQFIKETFDKGKEFFTHKQQKTEQDTKEEEK